MCLVQVPDGMLLGPSSRLIQQSMGETRQIQSSIEICTTTVEMEVYQQAVFKAQYALQSWPIIGVGACGELLQDDMFRASFSEVDLSCSCACSGRRYKAAV